MTKDDYTQFVMIWQTYQSIYRPQAPQTALAAVYEALKDLSLIDIMKALKVYSLTAVRAPVPADVRKLIKNESDNQEISAVEFLAKLDRNLDRACDYVSQDWRGVRAFKDIYGSLVTYCNQQSYEEQKLKAQFIHSYKQSIQACNIEIDHLIAGIYHYSETVKVKPLETYAQDKAIIDHIYINKKITLCLSKHDPEYKNLSYIPEKQYQLDVHAKAQVRDLLEEYPQATIDSVAAVLKALI